MTEYKITLVGDGGVGKTSFVLRTLRNTWTPKYTPTLGTVVTPYNYNNNCYNIWDTAGQMKFSGSREQYYDNSDLCIIMCSDNKLTHKSNIHWYNDFRNSCPDKPIIMVKNKCELGSSDVENVTYYISAKNNIGIDDLWKTIDNVINNTSN